MEVVHILATDVAAEESLDGDGLRIEEPAPTRLWYYSSITAEIIFVTMMDDGLDQAQSHQT